jgi:hypothetical protein
MDDVNVVDPIGMCLSRDGQELYMGTGQYGEDTSCTWVYVLSTGDLSLSRKVEIKGLQRTASIAQGIAEDGVEALWVAGFNLDRIESTVDPRHPAGYAPVLARIERFQKQVEAIPYAGVAGDLALPTSIVWTGE